MWGWPYDDAWHFMLHSAGSNSACQVVTNCSRFPVIGNHHQQVIECTIAGNPPQGRVYVPANMHGGQIRRRSLE